MLVCVLQVFVVKIKNFALKFSVNEVRDIHCCAANLALFLLQCTLLFCVANSV